MDWWKARVSGGPLGRGGVWGAFLQGALVGAAGLSVERREKTRHKATLFGMYVAPDARSRGMGRQLVEAVIREATALDGVEVLQLTVTDGNESARRLYASCGFEPFGAEPMAMRTAEGYVAKVHLWRRVSADPG
jgi:GNAT superfamily N-acetyltransferase